jgi:hypothetical protein
VHLALKLRGGGGGPLRDPLVSLNLLRQWDVLAGTQQEPQIEMGLAAGGKIKQAIVKDSGKHNWNHSQKRWFNVQILNSASFSRVTGLPTPLTPIDARTYAEHGYPFFEMWEEPTDIVGDFARVLSVSQIEGSPDAAVEPRTIVRIANSMSSTGPILTNGVHYTPPESSSSSGGTPSVNFFCEVPREHPSHSSEELDVYQWLEHFDRARA